MRNNKKVIFLVVLVLGVLVVGGVYFLKSRGKNTDKATTASSDIQIYSKKVSIGKSLDFPLKNSKGENTDKKITITIAEVERTNQILFKGQTLTAKNGKAFTIVHMELNNRYQEKLQIVPKDLIRLLNNSGKSFAPDVHNNVVDVEPISVKLDRVGFLVDDTLKRFKLQIGEVSGSKELIQVNF